MGGFIVMSPSTSESALPNSRFVVVAHADCPRVVAFGAALGRCGLGAPVVVDYADIFAGRADLCDVVRAGDIVRIESPGRSWNLEKALLQRGAQRIESEPQFRALSVRQIRELQWDKGRLWPSRQWFHGLCWLLETLQSQLAACPPHRLMGAPADIATMFDKPLCHARLQNRGVSVAPALSSSLASPRDFEELMSLMKNADWRRVFLKLAHGSSAMGVVALQINGAQIRATTTAEIVIENGETRLYNSRQLRVYRGFREVQILVDALCRECSHVERWLPKASFRGQTFDARVVVIGGQIWDGVARLSRGPLTNLHLGNQRASLQELQSAIPESVWQSAMRDCRRALRLFPDSLMAGVDVMFTTGFRGHAILEMNAWGDWLPTVWRAGEDAYGAQIEAVLLERTLDND